MDFIGKAVQNLFCSTGLPRSCQSLAMTIILCDHLPSKSRLILKTYSLPRFRVIEREALRVEHQARGGGFCGFRGVEWVAQNRMAQFLHMNAELVRAPGQRGEAQCGGGLLPRDDFPIRLCGAAPDVADHLERAVGPVTAQRQVNMAAFPLHAAPNAGYIGFVDFSPFELLAEAALRGLVHRHDEEARCAHIQPVDEQGLREVGLGAMFQTILLCGVFAGNTQQARGLGQDQQIIVPVEDVQRAAWRGVEQGCGFHLCCCAGRFEQDQPIWRIRSKINDADYRGSLSVIMFPVYPDGVFAVIVCNCFNINVFPDLDFSAYRRAARCGALIYGDINTVIDIFSNR